MAIVELGRLANLALTNSVIVDHGGDDGPAVLPPLAGAWLLYPEGEPTTVAPVPPPNQLIVLALRLLEGDEPAGPSLATGGADCAAGPGDAARRAERVSTCSFNSTRPTHRENPPLDKVRAIEGMRQPDFARLVGGPIFHNDGGRVVLEIVQSTI